MTKGFKRGGRNTGVDTTRIDVPGFGLATAHTYKGTGGDDNLTGSKSRDTFNVSQGGHDTVNGANGDDVAQFGATFESQDRFDGGMGSDYLSLSGDYSSGLTVTGDMLTSVEGISLAADGVYDLTLTQAAFAGVARLNISAGVADVALDASAPTASVAFGAAGGDHHVVTGAGNDSFGFGSGDINVFDGGAGDDVIYLYNSGADGTTFDLDATGAQHVGDGTVTIAGVEGVFGTKGDDTITGTATGDRIEGLGGHDQLLGLGGDDYLTAGSIFTNDHSAVTLVNGGRGFDAFGVPTSQLFQPAAPGVTISLADHDYQDVGGATVKLVHVEAAFGTFQHDVLTGNAQANTLLGAEGADTLNGGRGDDVLYGDATYSFTQDGYVGPLEIIPTYAVGDGLAQDRDTMNGGAGDDRLIGGFSADTLTGGAGHDTFIYQAVLDSSATSSVYRDVITDFANGDRIDLSAIDADPTKRGDQAFHFGATTAHIGDIVAAFDAVANVTRVSIYIDGDDTPDMAIDLTGNVALASSDFVL